MVELLKYPVTVFSILVALIIAKWTLGISFGDVAEIGPNGVKFVRDAKGEIADLAAKLNGALAAIDELKKQSGSKALESTTTQAAIFAASQTVSDQTAQLAKLSSEQASGTLKQKGFIWIGDYSNGWTKPTLAAVSSGQPITAQPGELVPGTQYIVLGNMVVREGLPPNDSDYFRGRKSLGVIPRGTRVSLASVPVAIQRPNVLQYWAEVELP